jgi:hypothetical protein
VLDFQVSAIENKGFLNTGTIQNKTGGGGGEVCVFAFVFEPSTIQRRLNKAIKDNHPNPNPNPSPNPNPNPIPIPITLTLNLTLLTLTLTL